MERFQFMFDLQNHLISMDEAVTFETKNGLRHGIHFRTQVGAHSFRIDQVGEGGENGGSYRLRVTCDAGVDPDGKLAMAVEDALQDVIVSPGSIRFFSQSPLVMARAFVAIASVVDSLIA